ncbi:conserved hypothetical protein, partial [Ricinus communis]
MGGSRNLYPPWTRSELAGMPPSRSQAAEDQDVTTMPVLQGLARRIVGEPREALAELLALAREQTAMDVAYVSAVDAAGRHLRAAQAAHGTSPDPDVLLPKDPVWAGRVLAE